MAGRLLICATPIGNLGDVTVRVLEALGQAEAILAEDTRVTRRLLSRYDIHTPLERYDEHVAEQKTPELVRRMAEGETLALVSDAGTPGIADPGARLIEACIDAGVGLDVLPGPSAILAALVASGLPTGSFYFGGFLPRKSKERESALAQLSRLDATLIFYESPRRAHQSLDALAAAFPFRRGALARELTKLHEEVIRGPLPDIAETITSRPELKGEVVILVGPPAPAEAEGLPDAAALRERVEALRSEGLSMRDAVKRVSDESGAPRNLVYEIAHRG